MRASRLLFALLILGGCSSSNPAYVAGQPCQPGAADSPCTGGTVCDPQAKICTCAPGAALCGEACVNLSGDAQNCGACGLTCPPGESCLAGRCSGGRCPIGAIDCRGGCFDPRSSPLHCGGCEGAGGHRCGDGQTCANGICTPSACPFGASFCGACFDLRFSSTNCGACGRSCEAGTYCVAGQCVGGCPAGLMTCGADCVDLRQDPNHCGACGNRCSPGHVCAREGREIKCREYRFGCATCPCAACGDRSCCTLPMAGGGYAAVCVEDECPAL